MRDYDPPLRASLREPFLIVRGLSKASLVVPDDVQAEELQSLRESLSLVSVEEESHRSRSSAQSLESESRS